ncbi:hypothetical protein LSCM1_05523 [Leishmania martiniquensis]|uniref:Uncharacterized protein n=1 Tax=Leishmania martiniquensis TaxID=1580590 RepID=A0A836KSV0_9TRYP|nr:hypothetical protein LSCM1_05523 [Leishmania martiniquensis]
MPFSDQSGRRGSGGKVEDTAVATNDAPFLWRHAKTVTLVAPQEDAAAGADSTAPAAAGDTARITSSVAEQAEEYHKLLDVVGTPNYETMQRLFAGNGAPPASTVPAIQVSFELFEAVQNRFAATKQLLERTKADLLTRNQHYSLLHQEMLQLKDEYAVLQKRNSEAEERNTQLHQQRAKLEVTVEQLGREVAQGRAALDALRGKLLHREEELQLSQSRVAESLVAISQKEAVIGTLRRELGKCGQFRYGSANGARDGARDGEDDGQPDGGGGEGGSAQTYTARMLDRIAADVEGRSQEARMKLNMADLEGRLSRLGEEKDSILAQHTQYHQHVQLALQTYEAEAMLREDTLARHACLHTPYFAGEQKEVYAKLVNLQTGEDLYTGHEGEDGKGGTTTGSEAPPPPLQSFGALAFEVRRLKERLTKTHIDDASRLQQDLSLCVEAQCMSLQTGAELVGFLSAMEEEVMRRRLTLPEVRAEWRKARVPEFAQAIAQSLRESMSRFGRGMVGLLQQENIFVAEVEQARRPQEPQEWGSLARKSNSTASVLGGKGRQHQRRSQSGSLAAQDRPGLPSPSGRGARKAYSAAKRASEAAPRKDTLTGAASTTLLSASLISRDGQDSGYAEGEQVTAFTEAAEPLATAGSPTPPPKRARGPSEASEAQRSSATGASDTKASSKGRSEPATTSDWNGAEAASPAEDEPASELRSWKDAPTSLANPPSTTRSSDRASAAGSSTAAPLQVASDTPRREDRLASESSLAAVEDQQVAGKMAALPVMPSVVMCPHCAHEVHLDPATGKLLTAPADGDGQSGVPHSLASLNAAAAPALRARGHKTGAASFPPAESRAASPAKPDASASATQSSGASSPTDTQRRGARPSKSFTAVTKSKQKMKPGNASGATGASGNRSQVELPKGRRSASSSAVHSRTASPTSSRSHGTRASSKCAEPQGAQPPLGSGEQKISGDHPDSGANSFQAVAPSCPSKGDTGGGTSAAELASALSDFQELLTRTSQELQDARAANAALQAQLIDALAAAAASAPPAGSSTPAGAGGSQRIPHSSAALDEQMRVHDQSKKSVKSKMAPNSSCLPAGVYDDAVDATTKEAVRALGGSAEGDQVSTSANREPSRGGRSASSTPPRQQSPHASTHRDQLASSNNSGRASGAEAAAGGESSRAAKESGAAVPNRDPPHPPLRAPSSASPSLPADRREAVRAGAHQDEQSIAVDRRTASRVASAGGSQSATQLQPPFSPSPKATPMPSGSAELMSSGAEKSRGSQAAGGATSTHHINLTLQRERPSPPVPHTSQRYYYKRAGGGLAAAYAAQSQHDSTSLLTPKWASAYPPALNRRHGALTRTAASSTGPASACYGNASQASIPEKTRELGLSITNARVTGAPAKLLERGAAGSHLSNTTNVKDNCHPSHSASHAVALKPTSVSLHPTTSGLAKRVWPSLPPLSPSQVPSSGSGCPLISGTAYSSPVPAPTLPTIIAHGSAYPHDHAVTPLAKRAAALAVAGLPMVGLSIFPLKGSMWLSTTPQECARARPPSPPSAAAAALNKPQQRKIALQQLRLCLDQGASVLYKGSCGAQRFTAGGTLSSAGAPRRAVGGVWYSTRKNSMGGGLRQVMARRMRDTWARGHLYEVPITATPASVPTSGANSDFDVILGGHSLSPGLGAPCPAFEHPAVCPWQEAPTQSSPYISDTLAPPTLTYLATPSEIRRRWSSNKAGLNRHGPFSFSAGNTMSSITRRPWLRVRRTWQQQQRWSIRHLNDASTTGRLAGPLSPPAAGQAAWLPEDRRAHLPLDASAFIFSLPVSAAGRSSGADFVPPLFTRPRRRRRHSRPVPQLAKRDPMQPAVKRTVYTVSTPTSPLVRPP